MQRLITGSIYHCVRTLIFLITTPCLAALLPASRRATHIPLDASMIIIELGVGSDDETELVVEQSSFPGGACDTSWEKRDHNSLGPQPTVSA